MHMRSGFDANGMYDIMMGANGNAPLREACMTTCVLTPAMRCALQMYLALDAFFSFQYLQHRLS